MNIKKAVSPSTYYKLVAVFFLILILGFAFANKKSDSNIEQVKTSPVEPVQTKDEPPVIAETSTTTIKTYTNQKYGFKFKYSDEIKISASIIDPPYIFSLTGSNKTFATVDQPKIELYVQIKNADLNGNGMLQNIENSWNTNHGPNCTLTETEVSKMPAIKTTQLFYKSSPANEVQAGSVIINTYNEKYFYTIGCSQMGHTSIDIVECEKLIASFKLL